MKATNYETLISLIASKELELKEMLLYVKQLETSYNDLAVKYNALVQKHYTKVKRTTMGYKRKDEQ